jgi:hypothetical protein
MDLGGRSFPTAAGCFFLPRRCRLLCPLPLRERAQWCAHELEWVRGFATTQPPHPSSRAAAPSGPLPRGERAPVTSIELALRLTMSNSPSRSRGACLRPGFCNFASLTRIEGWAERRETFGCVRGTRGARHLASKTRVNALMTRHARRLRGALRPMTRDARLSALHRGGFGLPGPRFRLRHDPDPFSELLAARS